jgi:hypothetical protein
MRIYQPTTTPTRFLKCEISAGMFSNERAVVVTDILGRKVSTFIPAEFVDDKRQCLKLELSPASGSDDSNRVFIMAPTEKWFEIENHLLEIAENDLLRSSFPPLYFN